MKGRFTTTIKAISIKHFVFILFLSFIIMHTIFSLGTKPVELFFNGYLKSALFIFSCMAVFFILLISISLYFKKERASALTYSGIILSPITLLLLWNPDGAYPSMLISAIIILSTQILSFILVSRQDCLTRVSASNVKTLILIFIILYFSFFSYIGIQKYHSFSFPNPKDFAIYNQTFWNTVHGRLFLNSTYGSNFACHNSPFYLILVPFYYILPHPLTLLLLKILLLSLSVIPFYLIAKLILDDSSVIPLTLAFMFYPFLVSQNFTPPHEISYAPFFVLFAYYFFRRNKFLPFLIFLILSLSIKEHLSLLALMFGIFSFFHKKSLKWILVPILLGATWAIFSLAIIFHFQKAYHAHPDAAWFLTNLNRRFSHQGGNILSSVISLISSSNISAWYKLKSIFLLFLPLGLIPPLLSPVSLLGLPEFLINLLSDRPAIFYPPWHYNIIVSCFLLIGVLEGVKKLSDFKIIKSLRLNHNVASQMISILILSCVLIYCPLWLKLIHYPTDKRYIETVKEVLTYIPKDAFVSVPKNIAIHISNRERYSLIDTGLYGDYIIVDKESPSLLFEDNIIKNYTQILNREGIIVLKRIH